MTKPQSLVNAAAEKSSTALFAVAVLAASGSVPATAGQAAACDAGRAREAERLITQTIGSGLLEPVKGAAVFTVRVDAQWWGNLAAAGQNGLVAAISCAIAGPDKSLSQLRIEPLGGGPALYER